MKNLDIDLRLKGIKFRADLGDFYGANAELDVRYLLNRLEAAEKAAKDGFMLGRLETLADVIDNMQMYVDELKRSREYLVNKKEEQKHG